MLTLALASSANRPAAADSPLRFQAGSNHSRQTLADPPGLTLGGSLILARWQPLANIALFPQLDLLFARRQFNAASPSRDDDGSGYDADTGRYTLDVIDVPLLLRTELTLATRPLYVLGGAYGSLTLRAQKNVNGDAGAADIVHPNNISQRLDLGVIAGGGTRLLALGAGELFVELRYQHGMRALLGQASANRTLSLLVAYGLRGDKDTSGTTMPLAAPQRRTRQTLTLKAGAVATRLLSSGTDLAAPLGYSDSYQPGFWVGGALTPFRLGSWLALMPQIEVAFVQRSARSRDTEQRLPTPGQLALEYIDTAALIRGELAVAKTSVYALGGIYGGTLIRAQHSSANAITDMRAMVSRFDAGWIVGGGVERTLFGTTRLTFELRYQRGMRDLFSPATSGDFFASEAGPTTQQSMTGLIGIAYGQSSTTKAAKRITGVAIGRVGDRWLSTIRFVRIERAKRDGEPGYRVTYDIAGHGTVVLFWLRKDIDFEGVGRGFRHRHRPLKRGRLVYPTRLTRESLPNVYPYILEIEAAYAAQAQGGITAMEGFMVVAALGEGVPTLRPTRPPSSSSAGAQVVARAPTAKSAASVTRASRRALARALIAAGHMRPRGAAAHHIVAVRAPAAARARDKLKQLGIGINEAVNGVFLPATRKSPNPTRAAVHATLHTNKYYQTVNSMLTRATTRAEAEEALRAIAQTLLAGGFK
ncbi:MAG: hypothetical protein Tsb0020_22070 [Haliangiales bacterium]